MAKVKKNSKPLQGRPRMPILDEEIYTVPDGAKELQISPWTLWKRLQEGDIVRTKIGGRTFVRASELRKLIVDEKAK
jgi:hypothetical protein